MDLNEFISLQQFSLAKAEKQKELLTHLLDLHQFHLANNDTYAGVSDILFPKSGKMESLEDLPFLPVSSFKNLSLKSIPDDQVYKVITSSGTTGQTPSRIYLDRETATLQTFALSKIITHVLGNKRIPMLIIDSKDVLRNKQSFSARGAGILGLSVFGKDHTYALDDEYQLSESALHDFLTKYNGQPIFIFGFTFMVWQFLSTVADGKYDLSNAVLIHSGGWKKLIDMAVDNETFRSTMHRKFGLKNIFNFYGMVEQVGSVYLENSNGYLNCPNFADIIIRNPKDLSVQKQGEPGFIQVISCLPKSYPGHSILTEDIGVCMGEDDAVNGWKGKYFKILGRAKKAELRGCSDVFASNK